MIDLDKFIGGRNGIVKEIIETYIDENEPNFISFAANREFLPWENEKYRSLNIAGGGGFSKIEALMSCLGEIAERYSSSFIDRYDIIEGSYKDLNNNFFLVNPESIFLFSKKQYLRKNFPFKEFNKNSRIEWTKAYSYKYKREIYAPAFLVYLPYDNFEKGGCCCPASSTGLSCSSLFEEAVIKGLLEVIERDAFSIFWLNQFSPPQIELVDNELKEKFKFKEIEYFLLDITSDFNIPVVAAFSFSNSSFGYVSSLGLSCSLNYDKAIGKALIENAQGRVAVAYHRKINSQKKYRKDFKDVLSFEDHSYLYSTDQSLKQKIKFIWQNKKKSNIYSKKIQLTAKNVINEVLAKGFDVIVKNLTTSDIANIGLNVVRVIVPGLEYMHGMHPFPFLANPRIYTPSKIFNWSSENKTKESNVEKFPPHLLG